MADITEDALEDWAFVLSPAGAELLAWLRECGLGEFALAQKLRERTTPARAALLTLTGQLRQKAAAKFTRAAEMFFTRSALEQASAEIVSRHRAKRFAEQGIACVADLCCGAGGDALALAECCRVIAVDRDATRLLLAGANLHAYRVEGNLTLRQGDVTELEPGSMGADGFFIDPARRTEDGSRLYSPEDYQPPLSEILRWQRSIPEGGAKLGPGVDLAVLPREAEVEFISVNGELREAALWFGGLRNNSTISATIFPQGARLSGENPAIGCGEIRSWLYEPDPAVIRAGLVQKVGGMLEAHLLDPQIAFLTGDMPPPSDFAFAKGWGVAEWFPYDERRLKQRLRVLEAGNIYLKKRGVPIDLSALHKRLRVTGKRSLVVVLTRLQDHPVAILCRME